MLWIDRLEKAGRLVLWLTLASAVVLVPLAYINLRQAAQAQQEESARQLAAAAAKAAEKPPEDGRLRLSSMGPWMSLLSETRASGGVWFSNVSPRSGIVCVVGVATNPSTKVISESLASCKHVPPYASNVEIEMMFAGADLAAACKGATCRLTVRDVSDATPAPQPVASAN
jgi:hypothetical protein